MVHKEKYLLDKILILLDIPREYLQNKLLKYSCELKYLPIYGKFVPNKLWLKINSFILVYENRALKYGLDN